MAGLIVAPAFTACSDSNDLTELGQLENEEQTFGKATGNFTAEEWFPGGELGTTEKASYSAPTPAVQNIAGMEEDFNTGEDFFLCLQLTQFGQIITVRTSGKGRCCQKPSQ